MSPRLSTSGIAVFALVALGAPGRAVAADDAMNRGRYLYDRLCTACHGAEGTGEGPASPWLWPRPRDFRQGEYKWRQTASGSPPTDADLSLAIRFGVPGTSMHAFGDVLGATDVAAIVSVLKAFAPKAFGRAADAVPTPPQAARGKSRAQLVAIGRQGYSRLGCASCHGSRGRGDGPAAKTLRTDRGEPAAPFDLTALPLRRPAAPGDDPVTGIYLTLVTGLSGTPMPSYLGSAPSEELYAIAAYVDSIRYRKGPARSFRARTSVATQAQRIDRQRRLTIGAWPKERVPSRDERIWGRLLALNGQPPRTLSPAQASLSAKQCARCHAKQYRQWRTSLHSKASSPGLIAQLLPMQAHRKGASLESCQKCHNPLAEQLPLVRSAHHGGKSTNKRYRDNPSYDRELRDEGIGCAGCHVREWKRHGPPRTADSTLLSLPSYPRTSAPIYERSDFCIGCHQLPPRTAINGSPLLNTYREWLEGPYMRRGVQCQHCHMSNREHEWKGVHDADTFRQAIAVEATAHRRRGGVVDGRATLRNSGAGHFLPTTPTPAAWLTIELVDRGGKPIAGARKSKRIGRHIEFRRGKFVELEDTRIPPGESIAIAGGWRGGRTKEAVALRVTVEVAPDDYYEGLYRRRLRTKLGRRERALYREALRRGRESRYVAYRNLVPLGD